MVPQGEHGYFEGSQVRPMHNCLSKICTTHRPLLENNPEIQVQILLEIDFGLLPGASHGPAGRARLLRRLAGLSPNVKRFRGGLVSEAHRL